ncbi:hypothetical protein RMSM_07789 [Rhodopirellula maiorica SM1]|uniref:Uncharacterized protein n=1 Tax=Rhodopirellula maiorica SM1 TaxID=1265738 RepID=M5R7B9_9BACT|nr:hypothetical protein RMSM_07789 [Rhodopirellula maiorica SM1]
MIATSDRNRCVLFDTIGINRRCFTPLDHYPHMTDCFNLGG